MLLTGYFLDAAIRKVIPGFELAKHIDKIALIIVLISVMPIVYTVWKERMSRPKAKPKTKAKAGAKKKKR
jgi:hypothetical protein